MSEASLSNSKEEADLSALMRSAQKGDRIAYRELLEKVQTLITPFIHNQLSRAGLGRRSDTENIARDIKQETLLAIHLNRQTFDPSQFFLPWMYAICRYKTIDALRDLRKRKAQSIDDPDWNEPVNLSDEKQGQTDRGDIETLLSLLPEKQKRVLTLVKVNGLSIYEAALRTGYSPSDIKVTIHRAIRKLQKNLGSA